MTRRAWWVTLAVVVLPALAHAQGRQTTQPNNAKAASRPTVKTHDDLQPTTLPPLPAGMSITDIVRGDSIYHGKGACFACHGLEGEGRPAAGDALTVALNWAQYDWRSIDSLIDAGIPQPLTRSPIAMPPKGGRSDLTASEVRSVAAYIWAISQTHGEPWPGGHASHEGMSQAGADQGTATALLTQPTLPTMHGDNKPKSPGGKRP
jgi:mono/diheme cytochrome c family protein